MLQRLHILLEVGGSGLRLGHGVVHCGCRLFEVGVELFVIDQCSRSSLSPVDLGADRIQVRGSPSGVLYGLLAGVQNVARPLKKICHFERRLAGDEIAILYLGRR